MRTIVTVTVSLALGVVAGGFGTQFLRSGRLEAERAASVARVQASERASESAKERTAALERERRSLESELRQLRRESRPGRAEEADPVGMRDLLEAILPEEAALAEEAGKADEAREKEERDRSGRRGGRGRWDMSEEERAERRVRWEEYREQRRVEREEFFEQAITEAPDGLAQERIAAIEEYAGYLRGFWGAMHEADGDEEREALHEELTEGLDSMRELVAEQQDYMLRDMAARQGITDEAKQDAFVEAFREIETSPFFREYARWPGMGDGGGLGMWHGAPPPHGTRGSASGGRMGPSSGPRTRR